MGKIPVQKAKVVLWELKKRDIQEGSMNWNDLKHIKGIHEHRGNAVTG